MIENSYKTSCGSIHYFVNIIDKQKITLVFLPGLTADFIKPFCHVRQTVIICKWSG